MGSCGGVPHRRLRPFGDVLPNMDQEPIVRHFLFFTIRQARSFPRSACVGWPVPKRLFLLRCQKVETGAREGVRHGTRDVDGSTTTTEEEPASTNSGEEALKFRRPMRLLSWLASRVLLLLLFAAAAAAAIAVVH